MVSSRNLDLRSMTSILVDEDSLDLCLVDPPTEEVCWFLFESLLGQVRLIFVDLVITGSCQGFGRGSSVQGCTLA